MAEETFATNRYPTRLARLQAIARRTEASFVTAMQRPYPKPPPRNFIGIAGLVRVSHEIGQIALQHEKEFELVRACRAEIAGPARKLQPNTTRDYAKKAKRLNAWRPDADSPPDIETHCPSKNSYYPYRAAARWAAEEECRQALRIRDRFPAGSPERRDAVQTLQRALDTLKRYPAKADDRIEKHKEQQALAALGLIDPPPQAPIAKRNPRATKAKLVGPLNRTIPDWPQKVWNRLIQVKSPWLAHVAAMALAGVRPEETSHVSISRTKDGALVFHVPGAKLSATKGQPERTITVRSDRPEFTFLTQQLAAAGGTLALAVPGGKLKNPADALGAVVRRAGAVALGARWQFSAYVYRHALAADCKKDGMARVDLAFLLGHSVTETGGLYGFWQGGRKGVRHISAVGTRVVKVNHHHGKVLPPSPSLPECGI